MKALFNCRQLNLQFAPIWTGSNYFMPICNRPLLDYWLDFCVWLNIREVIIIHYNDKALSQSKIRSEDWGLKLDFDPGFSGDVLSDILARHRESLDDELLIFDGPVFPFYDKQQLKDLQLNRHDKVLYSLEEKSLKLEENLLFFPRAALDYLLAARDDAERFERWTSLPMDRHPDIHFKIQLPFNLHEYVQLNFEVLKHHRCFQLKGFEVAPGIYEGLHNEIVSRPALEGPLLTGEQCTLGPQVRLKDVILHQQVRIEGQSELKSCMVWGPVFLGDVKLESQLIIQNHCLDPMSGALTELKQHFRFKAQLEGHDQQQKRYQADAVKARQFLRLRSWAYQLLRWFIPDEIRKYYLNSHGETLIVPHYSLPDKANLMHRLFFKWSLHRVPIVQAVKEQRLLFTGTRLLPAQSRHLNYIQKLPLYAPGAFSLCHDLTLDSLEHWMEELYYSSQVSPEMDEEIVQRALLRDKLLTLTNDE